MSTIRIIPRLDIKGPNLVKGIHLEGLRVLGLPEQFSNNYFLHGADELLFIDAVASLYGRNSLEEVVRKTSENVFIPITVGGGIRSFNDIRRLLRAGADKVAINTAAIINPQLITEGAKRFGSQCIVVSIQAMKGNNSKYEAYTDNGRESTGKDVFTWAKEAVDLGAGEILITSIDQEGTGEGYDLELVSRLVDSVPVPVIACGGAGSAKHIEDVIKHCNVDAVSAASIFHYHVLKNFGVEKREEGNVEYLKSFVEKDSLTLKKLQPISIFDLKSYLVKSDICCINTRLSTDFTAEKEKIRNHVLVKTMGKPANVVIVDYGRSNLFSVEHALKSLGVNVEITNAPNKIAKADGLIIAGVGAFGDGMKGMQENGLISTIQNCAVSGKPILGICLGMQLFMSSGEEFGLHEGIGLIKGTVVKLKESNGSDPEFKVPHIGWKRIDHPMKDDKYSDWSKFPILKDIKPGDLLYFIHSYVVLPQDSSLILAETTHGSNIFCSIIKKDNIMGCQFHPERSGLAGLSIYKNFVVNL